MQSLRTLTLSAAMGTIALCGSLLNVQAQAASPEVFGRPAVRAEADIARLFGCNWKTMGVYAECDDIRHVGLRLSLGIDAVSGLIDQIEIVAQLRRRNLTPEQRRSSDQAAIALLQYFTEGWPAGRGWATLVVEEAGAEHAQATLTLGDFVLSSENAHPNFEDGLELLFIRISKKAN